MIGVAGMVHAGRLTVTYLLFAKCRNGIIPLVGNFWPCGSQAGASACRQKDVESNGGSLYCSTKSAIPHTQVADRQLANLELLP